MRFPIDCTMQKKLETRERRLLKFVQMLKAGETLHKRPDKSVRRAVQKWACHEGKISLAQAALIVLSAGEVINRFRNFRCSPPKAASSPPHGASTELRPTRRVVFMLAWRNFA